MLWVVFLIFLLCIRELDLNSIIAMFLCVNRYYYIIASISINNRHE